MKSKTTTFDQLLDKEKCINFFVRYGYYIHTEEEHALVLKKAGSVFTIYGEKMPKELSISFKDNRTKLSLKYDALVLFDSGDLQNELDRISNLMTTNMNRMV